MTAARRLIRRNDARELVGKMLFGGDWIGALAEKDQRLLREPFAPKRKAVVRNGALIGHVDIFEHPCAPGQAVDLDRILGRLERKRIQICTVDDWLETEAGLDCTRSEFDQHQPKTAMSSRLEAHPSADGPARRRRGPLPSARSHIVAKMLADLGAGTMTIASLTDMKEEAMATQFGRSREVVRKARDLALSEFQKKTTPTNSDRPPEKLRQTATRNK